MYVDILLENPIEQSVNKKPLVLVVDDDDDNLLLLSHVLAWCDYEYITAKSSKQTLSLARSYIPNLILLDIVLPDSNGFELIHTLKKDRLTKKIPIIAVTGLARDEDRERIENAGCDDYICKPYMLDNLKAIIHRHLRQI